MIDRTVTGDRKQISLYIPTEQLALIDREALEHGLSRNHLIIKILTKIYPYNNKEVKKSNGTGLHIGSTNGNETGEDTGAVFTSNESTDTGFSEDEFSRDEFSEY